jgi:hypothetical protein
VGAGAGAGVHATSVVVLVVSVIVSVVGVQVHSEVVDVFESQEFPFDLVKDGEPGFGRASGPTSAKAAASAPAATVSPPPPPPPQAASNAALQKSPVSAGHVFLSVNSYSTSASKARIVSTGSSITNVTA